MKRIGTILCMVALAGTVHAGALEPCNKTTSDQQTQLAFQPFAAYRGQIVTTGTGNAPSITLPGLTWLQPNGSTVTFKNLIVNFQNRSDFQGCFDTTASGTGANTGLSPNNNWCGSNPPTTTVSNTAWVYKQASIRVLPVSGSIPTSMYISTSVAATTGYSICGEQ